MSDHALLGKAAKAAGVNVSDYGGVEIPSEELRHVWNPPTNDGDAFRLAVQLHINIRYTWDGENDEYDAVYAERGAIRVEEQIGLFGLVQIDEYEATRRAIVRVAAALKDTQ